MVVRGGFNTQKFLAGKVRVRPVTTVGRAGSTIKTRQPNLLQTNTNSVLSNHSIKDYKTTDEIYRDQL